MSKLYVNQIYPQSGNLVELSGNLHVSGTLNAYRFETIVHNSTTYQGDNSFGNDAADVSTFTSQVTASVGAFLASGKKLRVGAAEEFISGDGSTLSIESVDGSIAVGAALADGQTLKLGKNGAVETIIAPHGTAGSELYSVINTAGTTDGTDAAGSILLSAVAGGIGLAWADGKDLWAEGGQFVVTANHNTAGAIKLHADAGTSQTILIQNDAGTGAGAVNIAADAGGITLDAGTDIIIDADESTVYFKDAGTVYARLSSDQGFTVNGALAASGSVTLGDAAADVITVTGQLTASEGLTSTGDAFFNSDVTLGNAAADIITSTGQLTASQGIDVDGRAFFNAAVALGDAAADVITVTGQLTASEGINLPDNERLSFGTGHQTDMYLQNTGATGSLSSSMAFEVYMADDTGHTDGTKGAFIFKDSSGEYISFITRPGAERMAISKEFNAYTDTPITLGNEANVALKVVETSGANTGSLSASCAFEVNMADDTGHTDSSKAAFTFKDSHGAYLTFNTRPGQEMMMVEKEFNASNDTPISFGDAANFKLKSTGTTGSLSSSVAFEVNMADDTGHTDSTKAAFTFKDSAASYLTFNTRIGQEMMVVEKEFNASDDTPISLGSAANFTLKYSSNTGSLSGSSKAFNIHVGDQIADAYSVESNGDKYYGFDTRDLPNTPGAGVNGAEDGCVVNSFVTHQDGIICTTILVNIDDLVDSGTVKDVIGENDAGNAYISQVTTARNGIIYEAQLICTEDPAGTNAEADLDLVANTSALAEDAEYDSTGNATLLVDAGADFEAGKSKRSAGMLDMANMPNAYLYLANGSGAASGGTYTAGKFIIKLWGYEAFGS